MNFKDAGPRTVVALVIAGLWAVSYVVAVIERDYQGLSLTTPVMLIAAGVLLSVGRKNGDS